MDAILWVVLAIVVIAVTTAIAPKLNIAGPLILVLARLNGLSSGGSFSTAALRHALAELDADQLSLQLRLDDQE